MQIIPALAAIAQVFKEDGTPFPSWLVLLHPLEFPAYLFAAFFSGTSLAKYSPARWTRGRLGRAFWPCPF